MSHDVVCPEHDCPADLLVGLDGYFCQIGQHPVEAEHCQWCGLARPLKAIKPSGERLCDICRAEIAMAEILSAVNQ